MAGSAGTTSSSSASAGGDAQSQISSALQQQNLSGVTANVSDKSIDLTGTVNSKAEKDQAKSIANQYASGKKVKDHIKVNSSNGSSDKK
jgi:osmotically-inducible protein OsmY